MPSVEASRPVEAAAEDEEEPDEILWNLGFVEEPEKPHLLLRHRFPSKVGGRPAWLDPVRLPSREHLTCQASGKPLDFLLQIYAPVDANPVEGFHRSLFLFISPEGSRLNEPGAVRLFRCQLPRSNPYYSSQPPTAKDKYPAPLKPGDAEASRERDPWRSVDAERPPASGPSTSGSSPASANKRKGAAAAVRAAAAAAASGAAEAEAAAGGATVATESPGTSASSSAAATSAAAPLPRVGVQGPGGLYPELELLVEPEEEEDDAEEGDESDESEYEEVVDEPPQPQQQEQEQQQQQEQGQAEGSGTAEGRGAEAEAGTAPGGGASGGAEDGGRHGSAAGGGHRGDVKSEVRSALQRYRARVAVEGELDDEELPPDVMEALEDAATPAQRCFADFQARVARAPQQVIRYCFQDGAQPLWPAPHGRPGPADIPPCPNCGSRRKLEFQVLPQLLHYLKLDEQDPSSPDWSTLVAYTCSAACSPRAGADSAYLEELVWVQAPSA